MIIIELLPFIAFFLLLEGFFSGSEIGMVSADRVVLKHAAARGSRGAKLTLSMLNRPEKLLTVTLIGTNLSTVLNTTMVTATLVEYFGPKGGLYSILILTPLIWIFGEIVPKSIFQQHPNKIVPRIIFILKAASYLFFPVMILMNAITWTMTKLFGMEHQNPFTLREEMVLLMKEPKLKGDIQPLEQIMIRKMFQFGEKDIREIMVPINKVVSVSHKATCGEAWDQAESSKHVRLLVYEEKKNNLTGLINTLDLINKNKDLSISDLIHDLHIVEGNIGLNELLFKMRKEEFVIAGVTEKSKPGRIIGIVSIEDIVEEIVDDIEDEYDE